MILLRVVLAALLLPNAVFAERLLIEGVTLVDARNGTSRANMDVVIEGDRIQTVQPHSAGKLEADRTVSGQGRYLIPGLWDMHVHAATNASRYFPLLVANGVTGVRNMHTTAKDPVALCLRIKKDLADGRLMGPRFYANGPIVDGPKPLNPGSIAVANAGEATAAVRKLHDAGMDFIKVYDLLPRDAYFAIALESKRLGMPFEGHVPFGVTVEEAARAGQKSIEHIDAAMLENCSKDPQKLRALAAKFVDEDGADRMRTRMEYIQLAIASFDAARVRPMVQELKRHGTFVCPTIVLVKSYAEVIAGREDWSALGSVTVKDWTDEIEEGGPFLDAVGRAHTSVGVLMRELIAQHVPLLAGTDIGNPGLVPGLSLHEELELLAKAGLSNPDVLRIATVAPAQFFGIESHAGAIEPGKDADLVLLMADPLQDVKSLRKIDAVVLRGRYLNRADLDGLVAKAKAPRN